MRGLVYVACKAGSIGDHIPPDGRIVIEQQLPEIEPGDRAWENRRRELFRDEADAIADVLLACLPQGTTDALLAELLRRQASLLSPPAMQTPEVEP